MGPEADSGASVRRAEAPQPPERQGSGARRLARREGGRGIANQRRDIVGHRGRGELVTASDAALDAVRTVEDGYRLIEELSVLARGWVIKDSMFRLAMKATTARAR